MGIMNYVKMKRMAYKERRKQKLADKKAANLERLKELRYERKVYETKAAVQREKEKVRSLKYSGLKKGGQTASKLFKKAGKAIDKSKGSGAQFVEKNLMPSKENTKTKGGYDPYEIKNVFK